MQRGNSNAEDAVRTWLRRIEGLVRGLVTRDRDAAGAACPATSGAVPGCATGPGGRISFVGVELADLWRELRGHARSTSGPNPDKDIEK